MIEIITILGGIAGVVLLCQKILRNKHPVDEKIVPPIPEVPQDNR